MDETSVVRERLVERTCEWCGAPAKYSGRGRPPRYCRPAHHRRAGEVRTAQERADRPVTEGGQDQRPVREVVERTETVVRTVVRQGPVQIWRVPGPSKRMSGQPYTLPEAALERMQALAHLRRAMNDSKIVAFREQIARACERTARALRDGGPDAPPPDPLSRAP
ncbi:hypothetical protein [Streptomyces bluensis]|uniref:hypothetical protein n=1 Tax=Streptomyces bluensis TaxID=33897 RepID=UPI0016789AC7|nr:hypothetical protein [Streptomyces bluensis]GGZ40028.1 hypothetical protein GCM10010344_00580 [Streptomyces bluensis]